MMHTLQEALEANSLEHKLEMQIKASLDGEQMNEYKYDENGKLVFNKYAFAEMSELKEIHSLPNISEFGKMYGKSFMEVSQLKTAWKRINPVNPPLYCVYTSCKTKAAHDAFYVCEHGSFISRKECKIGIIYVMEDYGCKYLRFNPSNSSETFYFFR
ncbi:MAG: hypothetical protein HDS75_07480 [Bacteroidales bacterium]|nr:hypothetical protein [Bacteroidales bacterium]